MSRRETIADIETSLGIPTGGGEAYANPLDLARSYEFSRRETGRGGKDYRVRALDRCIKHKVTFRSEVNSMRELLIRIMPTFTCPACGETIKANGSGGASCGPMSAHSYGGTCKCGVSVGITLMDNAVSVSFPEEKKE